MGRYRRRRPDEITAGQVAAQAAIVLAAQNLTERSASLLAQVDPARPFTVDLAAETNALLVAADDASTRVRKEIVTALAGVHSHEVLGEIVGMSPWWVGKVLREAGQR